MGCSSAMETSSTPCPTECSNLDLKDHVWERSSQQCTSLPQGQMLHCVWIIPPQPFFLQNHPLSLRHNYTFFWHCLQGQKTSVASTHISQRSSSCGTGDAQEEPPAPCVVLSPPTTSQPNQSSCRPFRNQLHPHAATHREVKPGEQHQGLAHPGQRDVSVRAGMSCCLDLPLYLPLLQSRQPATISFPTSFN